MFHSRLHPALVLGALAIALMIIGAPFVSYWVSFFLLGKISVVAALLQKSSHPVFPLLPGFIAGLSLVGIGLTLGRRMSTAASWAFTISGGVVLMTSVLAMWLFSLVALPRFQMHAITFDATVWAQADCGTTRVRQQMLADLKSKIEGLNQEQIVALIGEPTDGKSSYCLGPEPHVIPVDREFMQVLYTRDGRAADLKISAN